MRLLVLVVLGGAHGLLLKLKKSNHPSGLALAQKGSAVLDEYVTETLNRGIPGYEKEAKAKKIREGNYGTSARESLGWFDEPKDLWAIRQERHTNQMTVQDTLLKSCVADVMFKQCLPHCHTDAGQQATCTAQQFWFTHYEPSFKCVHEEELKSFETNEHTNFWVCDPNKIKMKIADTLVDYDAGDRTEKKCLVYSFNNNTDYKFEKAVFDRLGHECVVHSFDMQHWGDQDKGDPPPKFVHFHQVRDMGKEGTTTVSDWVHTLEHEYMDIDLLRVDCDGCEWNLMKGVMNNPKVNVRQILVQVHNFRHTDLSIGAHKFFEEMGKAGYVITHKQSTNDGHVEFNFLKLSKSFTTKWDTVRYIPAGQHKRHDAAKAPKTHEVQQTTDPNQLVREDGSFRSTPVDDPVD